MKVVIAYNDDASLKSHLSESERAGEEEVISSAEEVMASLGDAYKCTLLPVGESIPEALDSIERLEPDVVFNLCEGVLGKPGYEAHFALALEMYGFPHTGCDALSIGICQDKGRLKRLFQSDGIRTPRGVSVTKGSLDESVAALNGLQLPLIVKPQLEDGGIGIDAEAVVDSVSAALRRCLHVHETYAQPALVEEFIDGRELNIGLYRSPTSLVTLPVGEVVFAEDLSSRERVVGSMAKWAEGSREDLATQNRTPALIDPALRKRVEETALQASALVGMEGYCRFDLRESSRGELFVIDMNPNPDIGPGSGFRKALRAANIGFSSFLEDLLRFAELRMKN